MLLVAPLQLLVSAILQRDYEVVQGITLLLAAAVVAINLLTDIGADKNLMVSCVSFGFKHGVPEDADLLFDVRFLPNPHFVPEFRSLTGRHPKVARYIRSFPQTREFIERISELLVYLLPHYIREGKSYLTISFGCTGGQHRSVMISEEVSKRLRKAGYRVKVVHRDSPK